MTASNGLRPRVLIIEDEESLRTIYNRTFQKRYDLTLAATGAEGMARFEEQVPDLAVLDLRLPDTDGVELLQRMRAREPELPVIVTTAYVSLEPQLRLQNLPFSDYIVKPFRPDELAARIDAILG